MALASIPKVILGSIAFAIFWVLAVFPAIPCLPIGRTAGSLLGAILLVIFQILTPEQAYEAINLPILGLLFGTTLVSVYLERADMFKYIGKLLPWKSKGAKDLLCTICLISGLSSALFTNDTSCVVLNEFILKIARQHNLPPHPFFLALASSANIGSSATPIGNNPQNLVIAIQGKISFRKFVIGVLPAMLVGVLVNILILITMYWRLLSIHKDEENPNPNVLVVMSHLSPFDSQERNSCLEHSTNVQSKEGINDIASMTKEEINTSKTVEAEDKPREAHVMHYLENVNMKWKRVIWKSCVCMITLVMLIAMLLSFNMSWTATLAALILVVLDFKDARPCFGKVSYSLLIFFCGMFITVDGFKKTGNPGAMWNLMEPYSQIDHASGIAILAVVILVLSNLALNVPTGEQD